MFSSIKTTRFSLVNLDGENIAIIENKLNLLSIYRTWMYFFISFFSMCLIGRAITHCKAALEIDKENIKALYHYGKALHQLGEFQRAREFLIRAKKQHQKQRKCDDKNINAELQKLENSMRDFDVLYKGMCQKMFSKPQGQTEEEKARSNEIIQKAEDKSMKISEEFKNLARKHLQSFVDDPDVIELPWPSLNLTVAETACIVETAEDMGLDVRQIGSGQYMKMKIFKKSPIISNE